jgi:hypothetical protein
VVIYERKAEVENPMRILDGKRIEKIAINDKKLKKAKNLLGASTDEETIEIALTELIKTRQQDDQAWKATAKLLKSGIEVRDVFGRVND